MDIIPFGPVIPLLQIYPIKYRHACLKMHMAMYIIALDTITKGTFGFNGDWLKKLQYIHTDGPIYVAIKIGKEAISVLVSPKCIKWKRAAYTTVYIQAYLGDTGCSVSRLLQ